MEPPETMDLSPTQVNKVRSMIPFTDETRERLKSSAISKRGSCWLTREHGEPVVYKVITVTAYCHEHDRKRKLTGVIVVRGPECLSMHNDLRGDWNEWNAWVGAQ